MNRSNIGKQFILLFSLFLVFSSSAYAGTADNFGMVLWDKIVWVVADTGLGYMGAMWGLIEAVQARRAGENWKALEYGVVGSSIGVFSTVAESSASGLIG